MKDEFYIGLKKEIYDTNAGITASKNFEMQIDKLFFSNIIDKIFDLRGLQSLNTEYRQGFEFDIATAVAYNIECSRLNTYKDAIQETFKDNIAVQEFLEKAEKTLGVLAADRVSEIFYVVAPKALLNKDLIDMYYINNVNKMIYVEVFQNGSKDADKDVIFDYLRIKAYIKALLATDAQAKKQVVSFDGTNVECYVYTLKDPIIHTFNKNFNEPAYVGLTGDSLVNALYCSEDTKLKYVIYIPVDLYNKIVQEIELAAKIDFLTIKAEDMGIFSVVNDILKQKDLKATECKQDLNKMANPSKEDLQEALSDALEQLNISHNTENELRRTCGNFSAKYDRLYVLTNKYKKLCDKLNLKGSFAKELNHLNAEFKELKSKN